MGHPRPRTVSLGRSSEPSFKDPRRDPRPFEECGVDPGLGHAQSGYAGQNSPSAVGSSPHPDPGSGSGSPLRKRWSRIATYVHQTVNSILKAYDSHAINEKLEELTRRVEELVEEAEEAGG